MQTEKNGKQNFKEAKRFYEKSYRLITIAVPNLVICTANDLQFLLPEIRGCNKNNAYKLLDLFLKLLDKTETLAPPPC